MVAIMEFLRKQRLRENLTISPSLFLPPKTYSSLIVKLGCGQHQHGHVRGKILRSTILTIYIQWLRILDEQQKQEYEPTKRGTTHLKLNIYHIV